MAKKKEQFVKQAEQLQEVNEALTGAGKWIEDNSNLISWIVCGIAVVVMGIIAINNYVIKPHALEASNENAKAVVYFMNGDYDKALLGYTRVPTVCATHARLMRGKVRRAA